MRFVWCVLPLCVAVAASGAQQGSGSATMTNRHRRSAGVYLSITGEKPRDQNNIKTSVLPVQLPIQLGGQGGVTLPVLVLPVPVYTQAPDTCEIHHNQDVAPVEPAAPEKSALSSPPVKPPFVATRQQFSTTSNNAVTPDPAPLHLAALHPAPLHPAPHHAGSLDPAPLLPAQDHTASLHPSQDHLAPGPIHPAQDQPAQEHPASYHPVPLGPAPIHPAQDHPTQDHPAQDHTAPLHPVPVHSSQDHSAPHHPVPLGPTPIHLEQDHPTQDHPAQDHTAPLHPVPVHSAQDHTAPHHPANHNFAPHHPTHNLAPHRPVLDPAPVDPVQLNQQLVDPAPTHFHQQRPVKGTFFSSGPIPYTPVVQNVHKAITNLATQANSQTKYTPLLSKVVPSRSHFNVNLGANPKVQFEVQGPGAPAPYAVSQGAVQVSLPLPTAEEPIPYSNGLFDQLFETSSEVVQSFLRQTPVAPELPAVVPPRALPPRIPASAPAPPADADNISAQAPPRPRFNRSLRLRTDLNVPRADYTEAFETEWHAESQTSRTVVEDGGTTFYRAPLPDGRVQFLEVRADRSGDKPVWRCTLSPLLPASAEDQAFPGLPDMDQFTFAGYTAAEGRPQVERWQRVVAGGPGEGGAAAGESLTFHHEMLVVRDNGDAEPLRYTVVTDSSVLGPACDRYTQRYVAGRAPPAAVLPDTARECDALDGAPQPAAADRHGLADLVARFNPLREFALPTRDTRYDAVLDKFKFDFQRKYVDSAEEAVRKNLLTQASRFVAAGNRLAATFELGLNFLADRLDDELEQLFGVTEPKDGVHEAGLIPFPYSEDEVKKLSEELPDEFDWRPRGAVSPVRFQGTTCASCWAFAVAGATEGALFKRTSRLVPLSPQCLVDCGRPFGTNGCNGTWPSFAYDYVKARGLPSWDEYTNYEAKVLECKDRSVPPVTHINGHVNVTANSETALKIAIRKHAPNVVIVDAKAKSFIHYKRGVLRDRRCGQNKPALNHAVLAVGWGKKEGDHFILKNSWTDKWGEQGFVRVAPDSCALLQRPSYPQLTAPNIDREELKAAAATVKEE